METKTVSNSSSKTDLTWLESMAKYASKTSDRKAAQALLNQLRAVETFARQPADCKHERADLKCSDCGIDFRGVSHTDSLRLVLDCLELKDGESFRVQVRSGYSEDFWHVLATAFETRRQRSPEEPSERCVACGHLDRYHFDDGHGNVVCRFLADCACVHRIEHSVKGLASAGSSAAVNPRDNVGGSAEPSGRPARDPDQLCKRCRHSYAQHTKGPVAADYCRHCTCPSFVPYSPENGPGEQT